MAVHQNTCSKCHTTTPTLADPVTKNTVTHIRRGSCTGSTPTDGCHTAYFAAHTHSHATTVTTTALCITCHSGDPISVVHKNDCTNCHSSANGTRIPGANGHGDASDLGLQLRAGNSSSTALSSQIVFAYDSSGTYRHSLRTRAADGQNVGNAVDFYLWNSTGQTTTLGGLNVLSLLAGQSASTAAVHVRPAGDPVYELTVSDGLTTGAGKVMAADITTHSRRALKRDIAYLGEAGESRAYAETKALRHATFRYKKRTPRGWAANPGAPLVRGLIFEDAPAGIQDARGKSLVIENRLANLEMALKTANDEISKLETKIAELEKRK